ncbi:VWA domain-containing protein [Porticoccus sp. W117]|uniref:VWA domain-containing protein n=1 Tax=Porticoccus sp. W117 TaxID=3054777 RepID=UPI0025922A67|nr:VWA domain-containing protein [Porticoccus sp. W117]MDM3870352.1 VWA domain-containing protein [Porticoccus sp. W117]
MNIAIEFLNPGYLVLLLAAAAIWFFPKRGIDRKQGVLRTLLLVLLILSLAKPAFLVPDDRRYQVFVIDRSASLSELQRTQGEAVLANMIDSLEDNANISVISVGDTGNSPEIAKSHSLYTVNNLLSESDIGTALQAAVNLIPEGGSGAITLISDGLATDRSWASVAKIIADRGIPLNSYDLGLDLSDIYPAEIVVDGPVSAGQTFQVGVVVAGKSSAVQVRLLDDSQQEIARSAVFSSEGRTQVALDVELDKPGFSSLTVEVMALSNDSNPDNNRLVHTLAVQGDTQVLYIGQQVYGGAEALANVLGTGFQVVASDNQQLHGNFDFSGYDLVVIDDMPASGLSEPFQERLKVAVAETGLGVIFSGGESSFGPGGYYNTHVADLLPVELQKKSDKKDPTTGLAIIIDSSGSMQGTRLDIAKQVARLAVQGLQPYDQIGIVEFYGAKHWAVPMQPVANKIEVDRAIGRVQAIGGTVLYPAIEEAYFGLKNLDTRFKHLLILTDAGVEDSNYEALLRRVSKDGINVSTVLINSDVHGNAMRNMANWGKGRFYSVSDRQSLVELVLKQPFKKQPPVYKQGEFPLKSSSGKGWWGDVDRSRIPGLQGYMEVSLRNDAESILDVAGNRHPVLASWRYGQGRVTALMTELVGADTAGWRQWSDYGRLLSRVLRRSSRQSEPFSYRLQRKDDELSVHVRLLTQRPDNLQGQRLNARGQVDEILSFERVAPDIFRATIKIDPQADAFIQINGQKLVSRARDAQVPESQVDPDRGIDLAELSAATGGIDISQENGLLPLVADKEGTVKVQEIWPLLLALALLTYLLELLYRRWPKSRAAH